MERKSYRMLVLSLLLVLLISGCSKRPRVTKIIINIDKDFEYVPKGHPLGLSVKQTLAVGLNTREYESDQVQYGYIPLGNTNDTQFSFAVDSSEDGKWVTYVDTNNNEDLTDDGPPHINQGTGKSRDRETCCTYFVKC